MTSPAEQLHQAAEHECPGRPVMPGMPDDGFHCRCWYDGDPCCRCGDDSPASSSTEPATLETKP